MLSKILKSQVFLLVLILSSLTAHAGHGNDRSRRFDDNSNRQYDQRDKNNHYGSRAPQAPTHSYGEGTNVNDDKDLIAAIRAGRSVQFLMAANLEVIQLLPDDTSGLQHQKWIVRLSNGQTVQAVYNSDMCPRVPVHVGDRTTLAGMFLMTNVGPMMHWLHHDPSGKRPDGFVEVGGQRYCDK